MTLEETLKNELKNTQLELIELGIPKKRVYDPLEHPAEKVQLRKVLVKKILRIEKQLTAVKKEYHITNKHSDRAWVTKMYDLIIEMFGEDAIKKIKFECINRVNGLQPSKIEINYKGNKDKEELLNKLSQKNVIQKSMLINCRNVIDKYVRENEPDVNKGEYLKSKRDLILALPSLSDLKKL